MRERGEGERMCERENVSEREERERGRRQYVREELQEVVREREEREREGENMCEREKTQKHCMRERRGGERATDRHNV